MTDHDHNEIARRLRDTGTVRAPDRLRGDVMDQVRAEPRLRPPRRSFFRPVLPYAAAVATLAIAVFAVSHLDLGSGGSSSSGASGGGTAAGDSASRAPMEQGAGAAPGLIPGTALRNQHEFHLSATAAQDLIASPYAKATGRTVVLVVPPSRYANYKELLHRIEQRSGGHSIRVILRKAP
jgi:hypothetical protein